ncbi:response regulator [Chryseolinea lacunae]|uniref:Response regulator n=1 Tax=Chryseolinea lacunae TaxID=2801331 RepID=A0ABS1KM65_9BACT|nr:response regulator [Chryseolinea lacunae]MBL0740545.1 response regulator [Chryseolinea lacunae]
MVIVVVDDDEDDRVLFCEALLEINPHQPCIAIESGQNIVACLKEGTLKPDLLFIDVNMPLLGGYESVDIIRALPGMSALTIVLISTEFNPTLTAHFSDPHVKFLKKPDSFSDLVMALRGFMASITSE